MTTPFNLPRRSDENSTLQLIQSVRQLGIEIPKSVEDERSLYRETKQEAAAASAALQSASAKLSTVSVADFAAAKDELITASGRAFAIDNGLGDALLNVVGQRLIRAAYGALSDWEAEAVKIFNSIVREFRLNEVAGDLPDLADRNNSSVLRLGRTQGEAVQQWRDAAELLHPVWDVYSRIAQIEGHEMTGVTADNRSTGLMLACRLGNPGQFSVADCVATTFVSIGVGADSVRSWGPLMPFVVPAIHDYPLRLNTSGQAAAIRASIQPGLAA